MASNERQQQQQQQNQDENNDDHDEANEPEVENEETIHERLYRERHQQRNLELQPKARVIKQSDQLSDNSVQQPKPKPKPKHQHHHHHHHQHQHYHKHKGHTKEMIKPDPTVRRARSLAQTTGAYHIVRSPAAVAAAVAAAAATTGKLATSGGSNSAPQVNVSGAGKSPVRQVVTVVGEEQLHRRLMQSVSEKRLQAQQPTANRQQTQTLSPEVAGATGASATGSAKSDRSHSSSSSSTRSTSSSSSSNGSGTNALNAHTTGFQLAPNDLINPTTRAGRARSPPISAIIIPAEVARSLSMKAAAAAVKMTKESHSNAGAAGQRRSTKQTSGPSSVSGLSQSPSSQSSLISREQLDYGTLLKSNEVQVLYRSPEPVASATGLGSDRHLKEEQARQVAPNLKQSPIAIMSINPAYELQRKPLILEYPATVENLRLNNTGFSWEVKIPYQISMTTGLYGAHLNQAHRYRLDQFHCHWGGSEHTVDNHSYTAELHFVHYNMEKYHTLSKAARHSDGLVVMSVFIDANPDHHNHAELDKIVNHLKSIQLKGEHAILRQAVRIENLLPTNRSYWSYQGSLTTPPFLESVTWFVLKYPIRCNTSQIDKFKSLKSSVCRDDDNQVFISSNFRPTQPLNGRTVVTYDEPMGGGPSPRQATT